MNQSASRTINAAGVLPKALLAAVQRIAAGRHLYVPSIATERRLARDAEIARMREGGLSVREIAAVVGVGDRRVRVILARTATNESKAPSSPPEVSP